MELSEVTRATAGASEAFQEAARLGKELERGLLALCLRRTISASSRASTSSFSSVGARSRFVSRTMSQLGKSDPSQPDRAPKPNHPNFSSSQRSRNEGVPGSNPGVGSSMATTIDLTAPASIPGSLLWTSGSGGTPGRIADAILRRPGWCPPRRARSSPMRAWR
jgi:hypothetical protein